MGSAAAWLARRGGGISGWPAPEVPDTVNRTEMGNLGLSGAQEADLVNFLKTLSDNYSP